MYVKRFEIFAHETEEDELVEGEVILIVDEHIVGIKTEDKGTIRALSKWCTVISE